MKAFFALAFLGVIYAAELEPVELPEAAVPYVEVEPVKVVEVTDVAFNPDDHIRIVNFAEVPEPVFAADANANVLNDNGFQAIAPSELENIQLIDIPHQENIPYPYKPRLDPMWR